MGGPGDGTDGATWIYERTIITDDFTLQGAKLTEDSAGALQGTSVSLSGDGLLIAVGAPGDNAGATWIYERTIITDNFTLLGTKLIGDDGSSAALQGTSVSLSSTGFSLAVGGPGDTPDGATWVWEATPCVS